jgi:hypothetical protein
VEPLPETREALRALGRHGDQYIAGDFWQLSREVERLVPAIVGLSLSFVEEGLTFTMVATGGAVAELDGVQYLDGGPCEEAIRSGEIIAYQTGQASQASQDSEADEESRWQMFARATAAAGVLSTLSLPILGPGDGVVAGVNLYASTADAFDGRHEELAALCGGWVGGAVTNADLGFTTRFEAVKAPERLRSENLVDQAIGALLSHSDLEAAEAETRLRDAARRAGISDSRMALALLDLLLGPTEDT